MKMIKEKLRKIILENEGDRDDIYSEVIRFVSRIMDKKEPVNFETLKPDCHFYDDENDKWVWAYSKELMDEYGITDQDIADNMPMDINEAQQQ